AALRASAWGDPGSVCVCVPCVCLCACVCVCVCVCEYTTRTRVVCVCVGRRSTAGPTGLVLYGWYVTARRIRGGSSGMETFPCPRALPLLNKPPAHNLLHPL